MLAITFMRLLVAAAPLALASPFTFQPNQVQAIGTLASKEQSIAITSSATTPTTARATATAASTAALQPPQESHHLEELRGISPAPEPAPVPRDDGFAASIAATTTAAAAVTAVTTAKSVAEQVAAAQTTAPPSDDPEADAELAREGYSQTTYYSCEAFATTTHCGWHVPVVHVAEAAGRRAGGGAAAAAAGAAGAAVMAWAVGVAV